MNKRKFFICRHCGNLVGMIHDSGVPMICCGEKMEELKPNTVEAGAEKHLPVVHTKEAIIQVEVGSVPHPSEDEHLIEWVYLQTDRGGQRVNLRSGEKPVAVFTIHNCRPVAVYAYCNKHGLWMKEL